MEVTHGAARFEWSVEILANVKDAPQVDRQGLEPWAKPGIMTVEKLRLRWYAHSDAVSLTARVFGRNVRADGKLGAPVNVGVYDMDRAPEWLAAEFAKLRARAEQQMAAVHNVNLAERVG